MSGIVSGPTACRNCGRVLDGAYCAGCGQKIAPLNPSFRDLVDEFVQETLNLDAGTLRSARLLFTRPGFLTREYFDGRRAPYVPPLRLYLIFSVVYFAVAAVAPPAREGTGLRITTTDTDAELRQRGFETREQLQQTAAGALDVWAPRAMFVLVPVFAVLVKWAAPQGGRNYPQHLYFALHVHAAAFGILTLAVLARWTRAVPWVEEVVGVVTPAWLFTHAVLAFGRAYGTTTVRAVLRTVVVSVVYCLTLFATILAIALSAVMM